MCIFCEIVTGERSAHVVFESDIAVTFLDNRPLFPGHCLVVPRNHVGTIADLPSDLVGPFFGDVRMLASVVEAAMEAEGSFVAVNNKVSQSVPHLHAHVVPRRRKDGLRGFFWPRRTYGSDDEMTRVAEVIRAAIKDVPTVH